jgi:hypothetical protein
MLIIKPNVLYSRFVAVRGFGSGNGADNLIDVAALINTNAETVKKPIYIYTS